MFSIRSIFITLFSLIITFCHPAFSQDKYEIIPGNCLGSLKLGDCKDSVLKIVKSKYTEKTFLEEKTNFADSELIVLPQFILGFDKVLVFDDFPVYQIFKIYLKQDSVNCIMITSYGFGSEKAVSKYKTTRNVRFYADFKKVVNVFGEPEKLFINKQKEISYLYWSKGIEFVFEDEQVVVINIFKPVIPVFKKSNNPTK